MADSPFIQIIKSNHMIVSPFTQTIKGNYRVNSPFIQYAIRDNMGKACKQAFEIDFMLFHLRNKTLRQVVVDVEHAMI